MLLLPSLRILSIRNIQLKNIHINAFGIINFIFIDATDFHICCVAPVETACSALKNLYMSCSDLLPTVPVRVLFFTVSLIIFVINVSSILFHIYAKHLKRAYVYTVVFFNINNLLLFIYLFMISAVDVVFSGRFAVKEEMWRSSILCFSAFSIILWYSFSSQYLLLYCSIFRFMVVTCPLDTKFKETKFAKKCIGYMLGIFFFLPCSQTLVIEFVKEKLPLNLFCHL